MLSLMLLVTINFSISLSIEEYLITLYDRDSFTIVSESQVNGLKLCEYVK